MGFPDKTQDPQLNFNIRHTMDDFYKYIPNIDCIGHTYTKKLFILYFYL